MPDGVGEAVPVAVHERVERGTPVGPVGGLARLVRPVAGSQPSWW